MRQVRIAQGLVTAARRGERAMLGSSHHNGLGIRELSNVPRSDLILAAYFPNLTGNKTII